MEEQRTTAKPWHFMLSFLGAFSGLVAFTLPGHLIARQNPGVVFICLEIGAIATCVLCFTPLWKARGSGIGLLLFSTAIIAYGVATLVVSPSEIQKLEDVTVRRELLQALVGAGGAALVVLGTIALTFDLAPRLRRRPHP